MNKYSKKVLNYILLLILLAACGNEVGRLSTATLPTSVGQTDPYPAKGSIQNSYPSPEVATSNVPYPVTALPLTTSLPEGPRFTFSEPVNAQSPKVCGTGETSGLPIKLVNITRNAEVLSTTNVGNDNTFCFNLQQSIISGDRIGIMLGDLSGTDFREENFTRGAYYTDIPQIGIIFAMILVK